MPVVADGVVGEAEAAVGGGEGERRDVVGVEAADPEFASGLQVASIERHMQEEDIAVDIGEDEVVAVLGGCVAEAYVEVDTVGFGVLECVAYGAFVDIDSDDTFGSLPFGEDGEHACSAAHVEDGLSREVAGEEGIDHHGSGLVVSCPEGAMGCDADAQRQLLHRMFCLPGCVPVLVGDSADAEEGLSVGLGKSADLRFAESRLGDIGGIVGERLEAKVGEALEEEVAVVTVWEREADFEVHGN